MYKYFQLGNNYRRNVHVDTNFFFSEEKSSESLTGIEPYYDLLITVIVLKYKTLGDDVTILQNLLLRSAYVTSPIATDGVYGRQSAEALRQFQRGNLLERFGYFIIHYLVTHSSHRHSIIISSLIFLACHLFAQIRFMETVN